MGQNQPITAFGANVRSYWRAFSTAGRNVSNSPRTDIPMHLVSSLRRTTSQSLLRPLLTIVYRSRCLRLGLSKLSADITAAIDASHVAEAGQHQQNCGDTYQKTNKGRNGVGGQGWDCVQQQTVIAAGNHHNSDAHQDSAGKVPQPIRLGLAAQNVASTQQCRANYANHESQEQRHLQQRRRHAASNSGAYKIAQRTGVGPVSRSQGNPNIG